VLNTGVAGFSPSAPLAFPLQVVNASSAPQKVTLTNNGTTPLTISSMKVTGKFKVISTCGHSVAAGAKCTISAVFQPTSAGAQTGLVTLKGQRVVEAAIHRTHWQRNVGEGFAQDPDIPQPEGGHPERPADGYGYQ
jgi:hypothetical protein